MTEAGRRLASGPHCQRAVFIQGDGQMPFFFRLGITQPVIGIELKVGRVAEYFTHGAVVVNHFVVQLGRQLDDVHQVWHCCHNLGPESLAFAGLFGGFFSFSHIQNGHQRLADGARA